MRLFVAITAEIAAVYGGCAAVSGILPRRIRGGVRDCSHGGVRVVRRRRRAVREGGFAPMASAAAAAPPSAGWRQRTAAIVVAVRSRFGAPARKALGRRGQKPVVGYDVEPIGG